MNGFVDADEHDREAPGPELGLLFTRAVARSGRWVLLLTLLGAATGLGIGLCQPNLYTSNAKLSLRMGAREQLTSESLVEFDEPRPSVPPTMVDELQMLSDAATFERVAREVGTRVILHPADPARDDGPLTPAPVRLMHGVQALIFRSLAEASTVPSADELRLATKGLRENTTVLNEPGSSVILVSHTSTSPERAQAIVQALADAFIERHRDQYSIQSLLDRSRVQLEDVRQARDEAAKAFVEHEMHSGIAELETRVPRIEAELGLLENGLFEVNVRREEISRLRNSLSNRLPGIPVRIEVLRPSVMIPNADYETQLTLKRMLLAQKQEMLVQNRPSEEVRRREAEFDNQIAKVDQRLKETPKAVAQGSDMLEHFGRAAMEARIVALDEEDEALSVKLGMQQSRLDSKAVQLSELQTKLLAATMKRKDLASTRDSEETRYAHVLAHRSVLEALENIDVNEAANLRVLQPPTLEFEKVGPRRVSLLFKGLFAGLFAGIAFAVLRLRFERRLSFPESFERARGVPVLGHVPHLWSLRRLDGRALIEER